MLKFLKNKSQPSGFFSRLLRSRNVIIVSAGEVKHYPLSTKVLFASLIGFMAITSWVSYVTGSYLAAASIMAEKDRKIAITSRANRMMEEQYALLKQDLVKLQNTGGDLNEFDQFVVLQQASAMDEIFNGSAAKAADLDDDKNLSSMSESLLKERLEYLEGMVDQLRTDREGLLADLHSKTQDQITLYQDVIEATGLNMAKLTQKKPARSTSPEPIIELGKADDVIVDDGSESQGHEPEETQDIPTKGMMLMGPSAANTEDFSHQGGPFIPADFNSFTEDKTALMQDVDHMMMLSGVVEALPLARPMGESKITSRFGRRVDPLSKRWATHRGMDFVGTVNRNVLATADGVVTTAGREGAYGLMIEIQHPNKISTRYAHLGHIKVRKGQKVKTGDVIGQQGNSGRSTGSHLHYEVRFMHSALNPSKFIEAGEHVQK